MGNLVEMRVNLLDRQGIGCEVLFSSGVEKPALTGFGLDKEGLGPIDFQFDLVGVAEPDPCVNLLIQLSFGDVGVKD